MTPGQLEALQFGLAVFLLGCLVLAYAVVRLPNETRPEDDWRQSEKRGIALLRSWLSPDQSAQ
jgi:hypothetical protein